MFAFLSLLLLACFVCGICLAYCRTKEELEGAINFLNFVFIFTVVAAVSFPGSVEILLISTTFWTGLGLGGTVFEDEK